MYRIFPVTRAAFLALSLLTCSASAATSQVVDRVVAVVDGQVITQSELEFEARVALIERGGAAAATAPLDGQALRSALQWAIAQRLEAAEADRLHAFAVEDAELGERVRKFQASFPDRASYERFLASQEVDEPQLAEVLARSIRAEKVLDSKIRLKARVTEDALRGYYQVHRDAFPGSYEDSRSGIRDLLTRERYQDLVRQELSVQRAGSSVRLVAPFAREGEP